MAWACCKDNTAFVIFQDLTPYTLYTTLQSFRNQSTLLLFLFSFLPVQPKSYRTIDLERLPYLFPGDKSLLLNYIYGSFDNSDLVTLNLKPYLFIIFFTLLNNNSLEVGERTIFTINLFKLHFTLIPLSLLWFTNA